MRQKIKALYTRLSSSTRPFGWETVCGGRLRVLDYVQGSYPIEVVGDDLLVTSAGRLQMAVEKMACNFMLLKGNGIGTVTEAIAA